MKASLEKALVLELHEKEGKEPGKVFFTLVCYVRGQKYPELQKLNVKPENKSEAAALVGKTADLEVFISTFNGKSNLHYVSGSANLKAAS